MLSIRDIEKGVLAALEGYPVRRVQLFGSYAAGSAGETSDVDFIVEFDSDAVSLLTLSALRQRIEDALGVSVDLVHGPLPAGSFLELGEAVELYAA